jgi:outer membrane protein assembly factor BamB
MSPASAKQPAAAAPGIDRPERRRAEFWEPIAARVTAVAALFVAAVVLLLAWDYAHRLVKDPLDSTEFAALVEELAALKKAEPSEAIQGQIDQKLEEIRRADLNLRGVYFRQRRFAARGAWLLLGGLAVLAVAAKALATLRRRIPAPEPQAVPGDLESPRAPVARWAVGGLAGVLLAGAIGLGLGVRSDVGDLAMDRPTALAGKQPGPPDVGKQPAPTDVPPPSKEEIAGNWPRFRGPGGLGISAYDNVPVAWNVESGEGIVWKAAVPLEGNSSPIVWGDRVFLTGASEQKREVYCFSTADGKLLWQKEVPGTPASTAKPPQVNNDTGYAAPTACTDGRRVYAWFANGDLAAFDLAGNLVWAKSTGLPQNPYGHGTSLTMAGDLLIVQLDQGTPKEGLSKLMALDSATGKPVWEAKRPNMPSSWATPIVIEVGGRTQIVTAGEPWAIAYDLDGGKELWRVKCLRQDVAPSPVFAEGIVYVVTSAPQATAIRPDGQGDVTGTDKVLWVAEDNLPDTCSPLATPQWVYLLTSGGTLTCYDAKTGKKLKDMDIESPFKASPSLVGKYLYLVGDEGKVFVVEADPARWKLVAKPATYEMVAVSDMKEPCSASPAFQDGRIYLRTKSQLVCIGKK